MKKILLAVIVSFLGGLVTLAPCGNPPVGWNRGGAGGHAIPDSLGVLYIDSLDVGMITFGGMSFMYFGSGGDKIIGQAPGTVTYIGVQNALEDYSVEFDSGTGTFTQNVVVEKVLQADNSPKIRPFFYTDMLDNSTYGLTPWKSGAIGTGTLQSYMSAPYTDSCLYHPGVIGIKAHATTPAGYSITTGTNFTWLRGGEETECIFFVLQADSVFLFRTGFLDVTDGSDMVDGVYFEVSLTSLYGKTATNSVRSTTASNYTISEGRWYRSKIVVDSPTKAYFYLYSYAENLLWADSLATNIPTATGRQTGNGAVGVCSSGYVTVFMYIDYMSMTLNYDLLR
jgi:hypothetical protein